jgi:hypothetical protein
MATIMSGIGKKVMGELGGVAKKTGEEVLKTGGDIVKGTVENVVGSGSLQGSSEGPVEEKQVGGTADPAQVVKQQASIKKQKGLQRVREELAKYVGRKDQEKNREESMEERQEEIDKRQNEQREISEREMLISQAQRSGGGTGEMSRKKG